MYLNGSIKKENLKEIIEEIAIDIQNIGVIQVALHESNIFSGNSENYLIDASCMLFKQTLEIKQALESIYNLL